MTQEELDGLIERLLDEDHNWHSAACVEAATQLQALAARVKVLEAENERLHEELAAAYVGQSGTVQHASDCATSNAPAMKPGPCDCKETVKTFARSGNV